VKLFLNEKDYVDYDIVKKEDTVQDFLDAIETFLEENPIPCHICVNNCCTRGLSVMADNVFIKRISKIRRETYEEFVRREVEIKKKNLFFLKKKGPACRYLNKHGRCNIHKDRPIVCHFYICKNITDRHYLLRSMIIETLGAAATFEFYLKTQKRRIMNAPTVYKKNPAIFAESYEDIRILDILDYLVEANAIDEEKIPQQLFEELFIPRNIIKSNT